MVVTGKTIVAKRNKPESDSERERVRKKRRQIKVSKIIAVVLFVGALLFLAVKVFLSWYEWISEKEIVIEIAKKPTVEIIDEQTGQVIENVSARMEEYVANLEEEFALQGYKIIRARIPVGKIREIDLEIEGFSGVVKTLIDRNAAVTAEDGARMLKYLEEQGISEVEYIDVRVERKGYWKGK